MVSLSNLASLNEVTNYLQHALDSASSQDIPPPRHVEIPVLYGGDMGADLARVSDHTGLDPSEVIKRHSEPEYLIYFIGFSIGFPYFGGMDETLITPRLASPRKIVPAGSVGIAANQTGVYPVSSPGGWNLIGQTPTQMMDVNCPEDNLLKMGDRVKFVPIDEDEFHKLREKP